MRFRQIKTLVGVVHFSRRVGRCPLGCLGAQVVPFDVQNRINPRQQTSVELMQLGCLLTIFVPFETATVLLQRLTGIELNATTLWNWVQLIGNKAMLQLQQELERLKLGSAPREEKIETTLNQLPLIIGADGVMIPMRNQPKTTKGKTIWREIKVGIIARLGSRQSRNGKRYTQLYHRRLVAVLGDIDAFKPRLLLQAEALGFS